MSTDNLMDSKSDLPPPYEAVTDDSQLETPSTVQFPAHQPHPHPTVDGYTYQPGYQPLQAQSGYIPNIHPNGGSEKGMSQVVVCQPVPVQVVGASQQKPPDYLCPSILACLCCFWPTGISAIFFSCVASSLASKGHMEDARIMSNHSRNMLIATVVLGILFIAGYVIYTHVIRPHYV
ncbi:proline-rich transmembrane protein 1-like [Ruditapes philippinarum]|uniref:proline-rich transmembrane protein 1-like n=1 Tax=Ruditapes philippinarum TaxID=129788 RepID=UPI00295B9A3C|nr:proline-rich transmembrane protein 1-like [Ruditapes philippinarum]